MTETEAHKVMTEIRALWPKMPITDFILARYIKQLANVRLSPKEAMETVHGHYDRQRGESKIPRVDPPMKILIGLLHARGRQNAAEAGGEYEVEVRVDQNREPRGWSDEARRVLSDAEWAESHERSAALFESRGQKYFARVCRDRAERIRKHGLEGAGRPPVAAVIGGLG